MGVREANGHTERRRRTIYLPYLAGESTEIADLAAYRQTASGTALGPIYPLPLECRPTRLGDSTANARLNARLRPPGRHFISVHQRDQSMATVANQRRRRGVTQSDDQPASQRPPTLGSPRRRTARAASRWSGLRRSLVAKGPWRNALLGWALSDLRGTATVGSCSLGWFSPVEVSDLEIRGEDDQLLLSAPACPATSRCLSLLLNLNDLGGFRCEQPKLNVIVRDDGSNVEDALAVWLEPRDKPPTARPGAESHDPRRPGHADRHEPPRRPSTSAQAKWQVEALHVALALPRDAGQPLELEAEASLPQPETRGHFTLKFKLVPRFRGRPRLGRRRSQPECLT